ncbi:hypothetical protein GCM10027341_48670 [Spirosoma knui]
MDAAVEQLSDYERERGKPRPTLTHGAIQANLITELSAHLNPKYRVVSEVTLDTQPQGSTPDVLAYPRVPLELIHEPAKRSDAPLFTVEIQSPSQSMDEMVEKTERYFAFGVKSCWIVVPSIQAIMVYDQPGHYTFFHNDDMLADPNVGIELPVSSLFS